MQTKVNYNYIFTMLILMIGVILFFVSWDIDNKLQNTDCKSTSLKTCNKIVLCVSVALIVSSLSFFKSASKLSVSSGSNKINLYTIFMFLFGIILIVLGSIISTQSVGVCVNSYNITSIWGLGAFIVLFSGGLLASERRLK